MSSSNGPTASSQARRNTIVLMMLVCRKLRAVTGPGSRCQRSIEGRPSDVCCRPHSPARSAAESSASSTAGNVSDGYHASSSGNRTTGALVRASPVLRPRDAPRPDLATRTGMAHTCSAVTAAQP